MRQQEQSASGEGLRKRGGGGGDAVDGEGDNTRESDDSDDTSKQRKRRWPPLLTHPLSPIDPSWRISTCGTITLALFAVFVAFWGPGLIIAYV